MCLNIDWGEWNLMLVNASKLWLTKFSWRNNKLKY